MPNTISGRAIAAQVVALELLLRRITVLLVSESLKKTF